MKRRARAAAVEVPDDDDVVTATAADGDTDAAEPAPTDVDELEPGSYTGAGAEDGVDVATEEEEEAEPEEEVAAEAEEHSEADETDEDGDEAATRTDPAELRADLAAIALAETPLERVRAASRLGGRLIECAGNGDTAALSSLLRGHPRREATVWRVHHFRLGDVTPSTSAAHDDPAAAVLGLARSGDGALVAGELIAVDADGSAWTALARTDDEVLVQLPSPRTVTGPAVAPDAVGPLLLAWRHALGARSPSPNPPKSGGEAPGEAAAPSPPGTDAPAAATPPEAAPARPAAAERQPVADLATALDRLDAPGAPLDRLQAALQADLAARLTAIEARLALAAEEGARVAIARSLDEIRDELVRLRDQLSRLEQQLGR